MITSSMFMMDVYVLNCRDQAPWMARQVAKSWKLHNPDWNIEYVSYGNLHAYIDISMFRKNKKISDQAKSDIIRLALLSKYGYDYWNMFYKEMYMTYSYV